MNKVGDEAATSQKFTNSKMPPATWFWKDNRYNHSPYGQSIYIKYVNKDGLIHCSLLFGKYRVLPKKFMSISRLA